MMRIGESSTRSRPRLLVVGSTGRVGNILRAVWGRGQRPFDLDFHVRDSGHEGGFAWDLATSSIPPAAANQFDGFIVLAGVTPYSGAPLELNRTLTDAALRGAADSGASRVVVASSASVYSGLQMDTYREDVQLRPISDYGRAKAEAEDVCLQWAERGLDVVIARIGNVAGVDALLGAGHEPGQRVVIDRFPTNTGPLRSYIGPETLASALVALSVAKRPPRIVNVAASRAVLMEDLAIAAGFEVSNRPAPAGAIQRVVLDCSRLHEIRRPIPGESEPAEMVRQWKAATNVRESS